MRTLAKIALNLCVPACLFLPSSSPVSAQESERKLVTRVEPEYPAILQQKSIGGTVRLKVTVRADGTVKQVDVIGGNSILVECAVRAVKQWRYAAAEKEAILQVAVRFEPQNRR